MIKGGLIAAANLGVLHAIAQDAMRCANGGELAFTVEITRHCERAPSKGKLFQFAKNPQEEFKVPRECTRAGI